MKANKVLAAVIAVSLLATGMLTLDRWQAERSSKQVEIVADYTELSEMAKQSKKRMSEWLKDLASFGVQTVAIEEETLKSLKDETHAVEYAPVKKMRDNLNWREGLPLEASKYIEKHSDEYDLVVKTENAEVGSFVEKGLLRGLKNNQYKVFKNNGSFVFILDGQLDDVSYTAGEIIMDAEEKVLDRPMVPSGSKLEFLGLGFDEKKIKEVQAAGLTVSPRPRTNDKAPSKMIKAFEQDLAKYNIKPSHIIFTGGGVLGYDENNPFAASKLIQMMDRHDIAIGMIEAGNQRGHIEQDGINDLAELSHYNVVRVFPVVKYIQKRFAYYNYEGSEEIENTIYRAVTERNIRSVYFRPFMKNEKIFITDRAEYQRLFVSLEKRLADHGLSYGPAVPFTENQPNVLLKILSALGTVALGVGILASFFKLRTAYVYTLMGLGSAGVSALMVVGTHMTSALMGFMAAVIFPSAAILLFMELLRLAYVSNKKPDFAVALKEGVFALVVGAVISTIGGFYVGAMLSESSYLIEMEYFRGVKASLAAPFLVFAVAYLLKFGFNRSREAIEKDQFFVKDLWSVANMQIKLIYLLIGAVAGAIVYIYLARSGHETNIQPSDLEMIFRNLLEYEFLARPRTKEFLFAFPMVVAAFIFARKHVKEFLFPAGLIAVIGFSSIANTFSHLRTPLYLSFVRTCYSVGLGVTVGVVVAVFAWLLASQFNSIFRRLKNE